LVLLKNSIAHLWLVRFFVSLRFVIIDLIEFLEER